MKAIEFISSLKYNNLIQDEEKKIFRVAGIDTLGMKIQISTVDTWYSYDTFYPIPFTKEWALKFGFGKDGEAPNRIIIDSEFGKVVIWTDGTIAVHKFQNIYFDLTNSELTIKETVK